MSDADDHEQHPCEACDEPTGNERLCRECDIEMLIDTASCRECGTFLMRVKVAGPIAKQHKAGCSLRADPNPYAPGPWKGYRT